MAANNQGIMHLGSRGMGTLPVCRNRTAHMSTNAERFDSEPRKCKRCEAYRTVATRENTMKLSELILAVGDENVAFQNLDRSAHSIDKTKAGTKITFYTDAVQAEEWLGNGRTRKVGFVVWLPRDLVDAAIAAERGSD